jgi:hypothetical protein
VVKRVKQDQRLDALTKKVILGEVLEEKDYINLKKLGAGGQGSVREIELE